MTRIGAHVGGNTDTYTIAEVIESGEYGVAIGYQMFGEEKLWCTWEYRTDHENDYYSGHYMMKDIYSARRDALERIGWLFLPNKAEEE